MKSLDVLFSEYMELPDFWGIKICSANQKGHSGDCLLQVAVFRRDIEEVKCLLEAGADPNCQGEYGYTALHNASSFDQPEIVECLLKAGARQNTANDDGIKPIELAKSIQVRDIFEKQQQAR